MTIDRTLPCRILTRVLASEIERELAKLALQILEERAGANANIAL